MWMWLNNMLSNPGQSLRNWLVTIAVVVVLLIALVLSGPVMLGKLAVIIGVLGAMRIIGVPLRIVTYLIVVTTLTAGAVSLVTDLVAFGPLPLIGAAAVVAGTAALWMRTFRAPPRSRGACWATIRDLRRAGFLGEHGFPLGKVGRHTIRLPMELERQSILVTASTGSGKSSVLVIPSLIEETLRSWETLRSLFIFDPKDEVTRLTLQLLSQTHRVLLLDPGDPAACTVGFDPLATLPSPSDEAFVGETKQLAQSWFWATRGGTQTTDPFFVTQPRALMESLFIAFVVTHPKGTFVDLADWTRKLKIETFHDVLDKTAHPAARASAEMLRSLGMSARTIGPIWSDLLERFDVLDDPRVRRSMSGVPVDWSSFVAQPTAVYLRVAAQDAERLAPLLSMVVGQVYRELTKIAGRSPGRRLDRDVRLLIDEFGNLPRIYGIETALATLRSCGVGHVLFAQSSSQLTDHYGRELSETIQDNLVTRIVLGGAAVADAKAFSERCGDVTEYHPTTSWGSHGIFGVRSTNRSYSAERRRLITADEIIHMRDTVLISTRGIPAIRAVAQPYFANPQSVARLQQSRPALQSADTTVTQPPADPFSRDVPPPRCTAQEWAATPASLRRARRAIEADLLDWVTGAVDMRQLHERWRTDPTRPTPALYAAITPSDRAQAPNIAAYVDELAVRLQLRDEDDGSKGA